MPSLTNIEAIADPQGLRRQWQREREQRALACIKRFGIESKYCASCDWGAMCSRLMAEERRGAGR